MDKQYLTVQEFARYLEVHVNTVRNWIKRGMPAIKKGRFVRIDLEKAMKWLKG